MKVVSFDIWDTCLTRSFKEPKHLFFEVALQLTVASRFEDAATSQLAGQRIVAEQKAREKAPSAECRFDEIRDELLSLIGEEDGQRYMDLELSFERQFVRPILSSREQIATARREGATIAFISDMYLPSNFLKELLQANGFFQPHDFVFVSAEHRANKSSGALFNIVGQKLKAKPSSWTHVGDKLEADVRAPRRMGIKSTHFTGNRFTASEIRNGESNVAHARNASRIVGGMRAARLSGNQPPVLTDVVAPWLCALAAQMVQRAEKRGLKRLYFLSRDGEVLLRIAKRIAPPGLECRYLYSSRRAWCFPAMVADDRASRRWLETFAVSPRSILESLEFSVAERDEIFTELKLAPSEAEERAAPAEREFVWDHLRETNRMATVLQRASIAREACLAYLDQEGLFDDENWAICDVGWSLNSQAALTRLLQSKQPSSVARGFYFMVNGLRQRLEETGPFDAWLLDDLLKVADSSIPYALNCLSGLIEEFFLSSSDPSLLGYKQSHLTGGIDPCLAATEVDEEMCRHSQLLRRTVDCISEEWRSELLDPSFVDDLSRASLNEMLRFLRQPTTEEATVLSRIHHASEATDQREQAIVLARSMKIFDGLSILARRAGIRAKSTTKEPLWAAGSSVLTPLWIRIFNQLMVQPNPLRKLATRLAER